jgi:hypothetical protein
LAVNEKTLYLILPILSIRKTLKITFAKPEGQPIFPLRFLKKGGKRSIKKYEFRLIRSPWCKIRSTLDTQSGFDWTPDPELTGQ